jgi:hypothetical protein
MSFSFRSLVLITIAKLFMLRSLYAFAGNHGHSNATNYRYHHHQNPTINSNCNHSQASELHESYKLPVLPHSFPLEFNLSLIESPLAPYNMTLPALVHNQTKTNIARNVWVAFKNKPGSLEQLDEELYNIIQNSRKEGWNVYLLGHDEQVNFIERYYPNTSLLWAVKTISPSAAVSVGDIWRVAATYAFGGFYMDDDAYITTSLEKVYYKALYFIQYFSNDMFFTRL